MKLQVPVIALAAVTGIKNGPISHVPSGSRSIATVILPGTPTQIGHNFKPGRPGWNPASATSTGAIELKTIIAATPRIIAVYNFVLVIDS